jgi:hypothetical protein
VPGISQLFQPERLNQDRDATPHPKGAVPGPDERLSRGQAQRALDEEKMDPSERAAAQRLQQAIQRIQTNRDRRAVVPGPVKEDPTNLNRHRDW